MKLESISAAPLEAVRSPAMRQSWQDLTFLHWRYPVGEMRAIVPHGLEIDVCDGSAWVGLVPFRVAGLTLPNGPALPWLSNFPETNVRTYVVDPSGKRGVWFFSLDAARLAAVAGARAVYGLPYFWSKMRVACDDRTAHYRSSRRHGPEAASDIAVEIGEHLEAPTELELFLTARFRLYALRAGRLVRADVEHPPWPLQRASVKRLEDGLVRATGLSDPAGRPLIHFARGVDVLVSRPVAV